MTVPTLEHPAQPARPVLDRARALPGRKSSVLVSHLPFAVLFCLALVLIGAVGDVVSPPVVLAVALVSAATAAAGWVPWPALSPAWTLAVPVVDLLAVGLVRASTPDAGTISTVLVVPAVISLASHPGRRGAVVGALLTVLVLVLPSLLQGESLSYTQSARALFTPLVLGVTAYSVTELSTRLRARAAAVQQLQEAQQLLLDQAQARADELETTHRMARARAATLTSVIDAVTEQAIIGTDRDGWIRVWNPGAERILGVSRADVVRRRRITDFHLPAELAPGSEEEPAAAFAALVRPAEEHGSDIRDWTYVRFDGEHRTVSVAVTPRTDDEGEHNGWNFVATDMTDVRAAERMKDEFVGLISHELRTPLSSILGYLELVMDDAETPLTAEQRQYLGTVERNAHRLLHLVGDLLFTAQVDAGRFSITPEDVELNPLLAAAEDTARVGATTAGVTLTVDAPPEPLVVRGDPLRLGQALDNLVSNAVKFTPRGGSVTLSASTGFRTADGRLTPDEQPGSVPVTWVSVTDTGMGIPAAELSRLSERFFRASTARRAAVSGVGLGLTITKAIATAHGGWLTIASTEGAGTSFTLALPAGTGR